MAFALSVEIQPIDVLVTFFRIARPDPDDCAIIGHLLIKSENVPIEGLTLFEVSSPACS